MKTKTEQKVKHEQVTIRGKSYVARLVECDDFWKLTELKIVEANKPIQVVWRINNV